MPHRCLSFVLMEVFHSLNGTIKMQKELERRPINVLLYCPNCNFTSAIFRHAADLQENGDGSL